MCGNSWTPARPTWQQVRRGRNVQSLCLSLFRLNGTFNSNKNIKTTPQRKQSFAVKRSQNARVLTFQDALRSLEPKSIKNLQRGPAHGCENQRFMHHSFIDFWRLIKTIWPCALCCVLLLNTARDLLISLLFSERSGIGKKSKWAKVFVLHCALILYRLQKEGVSDSACSVGGTYLAKSPTKNEFSTSDVKSLATSVCVCECVCVKQRKSL